MQKPGIPAGDGWMELPFPPVWRLFVRVKGHEDYPEVKVVCSVPRRGKANFFLNWHTEEGRMVEGRDYRIMKMHLPLLLEQVEDKVWMHFYGGV